jgi:PTH1 family peptidyl-tRNA hydrolase
LWFFVRIVVGLGNPGNQYAGTRHNIGFEVVDYIAGELQSPFKAGKGDYYCSETRLGMHKIMLVKPTTYMNHSGLAVRQICDYFGLAVADVLIICDDYNLPWGTFRFRQAGSDGGHNGLSSVIFALETDVIDRFRFGIGNRFEDAVDFVLSKFDQREKGEIKQLLPLAKEAVYSWIEQGMEVTMNRYNRSFLGDPEENDL